MAQTSREKLPKTLNYSEVEWLTLGLPLLWVFINKALKNNRLLIVSFSFRAKTIPYVPWCLAMHGWQLNLLMKCWVSCRICARLHVLCVTVSVLTHLTFNFSERNIYVIGFTFPVVPVGKNSISSKLFTDPLKVFDCVLIHCSLRWVRLCKIHFSSQENLASGCRYQRHTRPMTLKSA